MLNISRVCPQINASQELQVLWENSIWSPAADILSRPCKQIRGSLTTLGFCLGSLSERTPTTQEQESLKACADLIELLHAGSLVVDDIQDSSEVRRGSPTLHKIVGMPLALNVGNWMYFYAFEPLKKLNLDFELRAKIYESVHETLLAAHYGQALDISVRIDELPPMQIQEVVRSSLELKSGALMALALVLGAHVAKADNSRLAIIKDYGVKLGVTLQMFDDLGNLKPDKPTAKHLEDLIHRRPSFVWSYLAQPENRNLLPEFKKAVNLLPQIDALRTIVTETAFVEKAQRQAWLYFEDIMQELRENLSDDQNFNSTLSQLQKIGERIANAY